HFFDGFRTSHEVAKIETLSDDVMRQMIDLELVLEHRARALSPDHPVVRGTAQNPDVFFQARERANPWYAACPGVVQGAMDELARLTGRQYHLFDYHGAPDAERVIVLMGSGAEAVHETVDALLERGEKVGVLKVRLFRPFEIRRFVAALPSTVRAIAVLDRTKEPGSAGEPLYLECVGALHEARAEGWVASEFQPVVVGGRYGLSSKELTPAMVKGVYDHLRAHRPLNHFTVGIEDDLTHLSIPYETSFSIEKDEVVRALFYGLGSDGTVGANKNSIKIIGDSTGQYAQGYFVYDSKKSGTMTVSHLRFGPREIRSSYLISEANFLACHQSVFLEKIEMLDKLAPGGVFLLNSPWRPEEVWRHLPREAQQRIIENRIRIFTIDANRVALKTGMGSRINTIMQVCFFALSGVLPREEAIARIKETIRKTYGRKGEEIVQRNVDAVDRALENLIEVPVPDTLGEQTLAAPVPAEAPAFVRGVLGEIIAGRGDRLPVSSLPCDGTFPVGTTQWEKRNLALQIPVWDPASCIQCGKCAMVCPHAVIRIKAYEPKHLAEAPPTFKAMDPIHKEWKGLRYSIQVSPEDCTGCEICVDVCPAKHKTEPGLKALHMADQPPLREAEAENWEFFLKLPELDRSKINPAIIRSQQMQQPLFEFSGACMGCGETPYIKLATQLFGDRMVVANATGCSSIYGGNLPTTPWTTDHEGRGPAWCNSLFEDNAEFGLGFRLSIDTQTRMARQLLEQLAPGIGASLVSAILESDQKDEAEIHAQRVRVETLKKRLENEMIKDRMRHLEIGPARQLLALADNLVRKSVWIIGGDGWAYDIGFGGLDHVLASGADVNILVLDTEVYSNTGGQMSKSTPRAAVAKFAAGGKRAAKKDLGLIAMTYGNVYVASVAMGARDEHTLKAFLEAEAHRGPSLIIAYSHCIAHGINISTAMKNQKAAVDSGQWLLYRYHPERVERGENGLQIDTRRITQPVEQYLRME
ncbi:MAG TPA: pyruvate:ferredoxin (flavodoxin) oxidoreductase, partial [Thermoanaerobaculia bacterium]|nr:pyruvate:ferredoxin (flavodoxin) oxidoreductase [Thermoanaerobaculia bacterium]